MYTVIFSKLAQKNIRKLDKRYSGALRKSLIKLRENPYLGDKLNGELKGLWKLKFSRYRIIYRIFQDKLIVTVVDVGHRKEVYR